MNKCLNKLTQLTEEKLLRAKQSGYVYTTSDKIHADMKTYRYIMDNNGTELEQVVQTHRTSCDTSCRIGWPRGFGELNPSPHSWIFTSVSADSSPRSYIFTFATVETCSHYTKLWLRAYPICNPPLQRSARRSAFRAEITVLMCEQEPCPLWFPWRRKSTMRA